MRILLISIFQAIRFYHHSLCTKFGFSNKVDRANEENNPPSVTEEKKPSAYMVEIQCVSKK